MESFLVSTGVVALAEIGDKTQLLAFILAARFKKPVTAGDQLHLHVVIERQMRGIWKYSGQALVDNEVVAEAELLCTLKVIK